MKNSFRAVGAAFLVWLALPAVGQVRNNAAVHGSYYVRYLGADTSTSTRLFISFQGIMTFDGTTGSDGEGKYSLTGQGVSSASSAANLKFSQSGGYDAEPSGTFDMQNPFDASGKTWLYGGMSEGAAIITASSGSTPYVDFFIAIPVSTAASNGTLAGSYYVATMEFPNGSAASTRNAFFPMTADGKGGLGNLAVKGAALDLNNTTTTQTISGATYSLKSDGSGTLNLPAPSGGAANQLLAGNKNLYVSSDGSFFIAGSPSGYDLILGTKTFAGTAAPNSFQGLYFRLGLNFDSVSDDFYYGVSSEVGSSNEISSAHIEMGDEQQTGEGGGAYDTTYQEPLAFAADGTNSDAFFYRALGANGSIAISADTGNQGQYGISLRIKAPAMKGSGVYLNPQAVVNAASNSPFTSNLAPGEFISLYGSGLSSQTVTASSLPFPTTLGKVQAKINGAPIPLYYVSPTQVLGVLPYKVPGLNYGDPDQGIRVYNNGVASNQVPYAVGKTSPGVFTIPPGGIGNGAILHACVFAATPCDQSQWIVTQSNPAKVGETLVMYLTGLGAVTPAANAGDAGPSSPPSTVADTELALYVDGNEAPIAFSGLAPGLAGLYQINFTIPKGVTKGNLEIDTVDATNMTIQIPIGQ